MLPTSGYFKNLNCPYFEIGNCNRVYCHFKHKKSNQNYVPTPVRLLQKQKTSQESVVQEYKPTPLDKLKSLNTNRELKNKEDEINKFDKDKNKDYNSNKQDRKPNLNRQNSSKDNREDEKSNDNVYKNIEFKLNSIFDDDESTDEDINDRKGNYYKALIFNWLLNLNMHFKNFSKIMFHHQLLIISIFSVLQDLLFFFFFLNFCIIKILILNHFLFVSQKRLQNAKRKSINQLIQLITLKN